MAGKHGPSFNEIALMKEFPLKITVPINLVVTSMAADFETASIHFLVKNKHQKLVSFR